MLREAILCLLNCVLAQECVSLCHKSHGGGSCFLHFICIKMIDKQIVADVVRDAIANTDAFLVEVSVTPANEINVEIDSPTGVDIDACADITRKIEAALDRDVEDCELTVGSAGLTAPFKVAGQYLKNQGNEVEVLTKDGRKLSGVLTNYNETAGEFTVEVQKKVKLEGKKRPEMVAEPVVLKVDECKSVKYLLKFK